MSKNKAKTPKRYRFRAQKEVKLLNARGRVTLHKFVRLELRSFPRLGIYPVFRCDECGSTRDFGCMRALTRLSELVKLYGPLERAPRLSGTYRVWTPAPRPAASGPRRQLKKAA